MIDAVYHLPCNNEFEVFVQPILKGWKSALSIKSIATGSDASCEELGQAGVRC